MSKEVLSPRQLEQLIDFVDECVQAEGCDHTTRFANRWAVESRTDWHDLQDALDQASVFCDCEIVLNLAEKQALVLKQHTTAQATENRWLLPPNFQPMIATVEKVLVGRSGIGKANHVADGEWLIPAPADAIARRRMRKIVHFFIGLQTGLPSDIAFVESIAPISLDEYTSRIGSSSIPEIEDVPQDVAAFIAQKIAPLPAGTCVGTDIVDKVGIASKHRELTIFRVIQKV